MVPQPAPRLFSRHRDLEDMAPSIVVHHERTNTTGPGQSSTAPGPATRIDSTTMTDPGPAAAQSTIDP